MLVGKKAVIVKNHDDGTTARPYGHALVLGLSKEPRKVDQLAAVTAEQHAADLSGVHATSTTSPEYQLGVGRTYLREHLGAAVGQPDSMQNRVS